jgi:hypothetical protein
VILAANFLCLQQHKKIFSAFYPWFSQVVSPHPNRATDGLLIRSAFEIVTERHKDAARIRKLQSWLNFRL